jgi:hypothetical protein
VELKKIDRIGSESFADQIGVFENVIRWKNVVVFVTGLSRPAFILRRNFRGSIEPIAFVLGYCLSEETIALAFAIGPRRIKEVATEIDRSCGASSDCSSSEPLLPMPQSQDAISLIFNSSTAKLAIFHL